MQVFQDNFFYHSHSRLGAVGRLEDERKHLVEEQKLCRARARKFSLETNRRRKVLEDRRKQWDMQEQRLQQNILQQRRQRVQDATERFQRAHLPPSERYRPSFRRNVPNIEDALAHIQGTLTPSSRQPSFSLGSRSCTPFPKSPTFSKSSHRQSLSAGEAYTKLLQEQSMAFFKSGEQTEKTKDKQHEGLQESSLSDCCNTDSLSSKDSLENEDPNQSTKNLQHSYSSIFSHGPEKSSPDLTEEHDLHPTADLTSFSAVMLVGDNLHQSRKMHLLKQKKQENFEGFNKKLYISKASWGFASAEKAPKTEIQPALHNCNLLTLCEHISADPEHLELNSPQNKSNNNIIAADAPASTALQPLCPKEEPLLDIRLQKVCDERQLRHPSATELLLPAKNCSSKDVFFGSPPKPNIFLNDSTTDNVSQHRTLEHNGKEVYYLSSQKEPSASINNLNKALNSSPKGEKPSTAASQQRTCLSNIPSETLKCLKHPEEEAQKSPVSLGTSHPLYEVRFVKGILKKQSKYISGDVACMHGSGHLTFAKQVALAIRDSVELTRVKTKKVEANSAVKKKLRWFDEVHVERKEQKQDKQMKSKSEDHHLSLTGVSGASKPGPSPTSAASTGYHFTKQAWADVGVQVNLPQEQVDEVKVPWSSAWSGGSKVPRRERSARAGAGPVSSRARKGAVIRAQSATEVNQIAKSQGRIIVPRPPSRMYFTKSPYGIDHPSVNCKQDVAADQSLHKDNSEGFFSPYTLHVTRTDNTAMYTPLASSCACPVPEGNTKGPTHSGQQEAQGGSRRRGVVYSEKGLCLDCTPTEEEISLLWHGVRSALDTNDAKTKLRRPVPEGGKAVRKSSMGQTRPPPGSGSTRISQSTQPTKQAMDLLRPVASTDEIASHGAGLESAGQLHLAEVGLIAERDVVAATEMGQTQRPEAAHERSQQQGHTTAISLEEHKLLLSLDRLNQQLFCVQEHMRGNTTTPAHAPDGPSMRDATVTNHKRHHASSANSRPRYQKRV
ncbi:uncharacterized protein V6R79_019029 [Siganus canaliculatus]